MVRFRKEDIDFLSLHFCLWQKALVIISVSG